MEGLVKRTVDENGDVVITDEVGGVHSCCCGWSPTGEYCGECNSISCKDCRVYKKGE